MTDNFEAMIGKRVSKSARRETEPKPFKSGSKVNTVKGIINHPQLNIPAFTFVEDDSYVECRRCKAVDQSPVWCAAQVEPNWIRIMITAVAVVSLVLMVCSLA